MGKKLSEPRNSTQTIAAPSSSSDTSSKSVSNTEPATKEPNSVIHAVTLRRREQLTLIVVWAVVVVACVWYFATSRGADATIDLDQGDYQSFRYTVELNSATAAELASIPGLGTRTANAIVDWRAKNGRFESIQSLAEVDGISEKTVSRIQPFFEPIDQRIVLDNGPTHLKNNENRTQNGE